MSTPKWPASFLEEKRKIKDPVSEEFIRYHVHHKSDKELYRFMKELLDEFTPFKDMQLDDRTQTYLEEIRKLPEWADPELLKKGSEFYSLHSPEIGMVLLLKSLPSTYCCWKGAEVVHAAGRFTNHSGNMRPFTRRLLETSKFVLNVMSENGLDPDGKGTDAALKVRTLHAFIRHFLFHKDWDVEKFGEPINQEDQAGTMLAFSALVIEGLEQLGIRPTKEEKEAYQHTWNVIGHLMGVQNDFMCDTYQEANELGHAILNHQKGESKTGKVLTGACLEFTRRMMPFRILKFVPRNFMYFFIGKEYGSMVGVYRNKNIFVQMIVFLSIRFVRFLQWLKRNVGFIRRWRIKRNPILLNKIIKKMLEDQGSPFTPKIIQDELRTIRNNRRD